MRKHWVFAVIILCFSIVIGLGQDTNSEDKHAFVIDKEGCAQLELTEQKKLPEDNKKPPSDYINPNEDDINARFRLTNSCNKTIYYLMENYSEEIVGFWIYRQKGGEWKSRTPSWRRKGYLTCKCNRWLPIKAKEYLDFEATDLSLIEGERSMAVYVSYVSSPSLKEMVELMASPYLSIKIDRPKK